MSRMTDLLDAAADALDGGEDPLAEHFLSEHEVTLDECYDLAYKLAAGARLLSWATRNPRGAARFAEAGSRGMAMEAITDALKVMNAEAASATSCAAGAGKEV